MLRSVYGNTKAAMLLRAQSFQLITVSSLSLPPDHVAAVSVAVHLLVAVSCSTHGRVSSAVCSAGGSPCSAHPASCSSPTACSGGRGWCGSWPTAACLELESFQTTLSLSPSAAVAVEERIGYACLALFHQQELSSPRLHGTSIQWITYILLH